MVFEGIDGSGTTTQVARYATYLRSLKRPVRTTREPSDGPIGVMLRLGLSGRLKIGASNQAQAMALLFAADRLDHLAHDIEPHLREGHVVLCDRYDLSSIAYQTATARLDSEGPEDFETWVRSLNRYALRPDVTLVVDVSPDEAERRRRERRGAVELYEEAQLQRQLAELYGEAERLVPGDRLIRIDGNQDTDQVAEAIQKALAPLVEGS
ncbi:MAG: dTMP kinase [Deltaproteobacteria bacterium]|nr:dTMP kinase [Deltaproteobacteria bacterium]